MQYPIIDNLIYAYQRNGWTGLKLTESKNLFDINKVPSSGVVGGLSYINDGEIITYSGIATYSGWKTIFDFYLPVGEFYLSMDVTGNGGTWLRGYTNLTPNVLINNTDPNTVYRIGFVNTTSGVEYNGTLTHMQIEAGTERTPYEPYAPPTTDIANRLKLPLPHYFPHPVIDALQRAAAGTQTADDTEILRHYLTPLGIGGI